MPKTLSDSQQEILIKAAAKVIREEGVASATTRRIAGEAGVPLGSVHYHFENKQQLFEAVSDSFGATGKEWVAKHIHSEMGVAATAGAIARAFSHWAAQTPADQLTEFELGIWALRTKTQFKLPQQSYEEWLKHYRVLLRLGQRSDEPARDIDAIARSLLALVDGFIIQDQFLRETKLPDSSERLTLALVRAIEEGVFDL
ncbi:TetR/AcrR family transcriptional regulator [Sinorhizobium meliloti]|uniref:TetR/AcrR family transcriptional regulator n=1 Tax=Rhizobium meliloti TaxID=382 RepID=UPI003F16F2AA